MVRLRICFNVKAAKRLISLLSRGNEVGREGGHGAFIPLGDILAMTVGVN